MIHDVNPISRREFLQLASSAFDAGSVILVTTKTALAAGGGDGTGKRKLKKTAG